MDAASLRQTLERIDAALTTPTELAIRGGAALLALGFEGRTTVDIDVLPISRFVEADLRQACTVAGLAWNPPDKDFPPGDYVVGKLKRMDPEDMADILFLVVRFGLDEASVREAYGRLPARFQHDVVLADNLRYVIHDLWGDRP